jgi:hypothetical protein
MRIDYVNGPNIEGKTPTQALEILADSCHGAAVQIMRLNNEIEGLKAKVDDLIRRSR